jgi:hypothetical protein
MEKSLTEFKRRIRAPYSFSDYRLELEDAGELNPFTSMKDVAVSLDSPLRCIAIHLKIGPFVDDNHITAISSKIEI